MVFECKKKKKDEVKLHKCTLTLIMFLRGLWVGGFGPKEKGKKPFPHLPLDHNGDSQFPLSESVDRVRVTCVCVCARREGKGECSPDMLVGHVSLLCQGG